MKVKNIVVVDNGMKIFAEDDDGKPLTLTYNGDVDVSLSVTKESAYIGVQVRPHVAGGKPSNIRHGSH